MILYICILFSSVLISAVSQILLKISALKKYDSFIKEYLNPLVIASYSIFFIAILLDIFGLRKVPVSYLPVIESSNYIFIIILSRIFLKERVSKQKKVGMGIIILGILVFIIGSSF